MDSLASLALASEPPNDELLKRPPVNRSQQLIAKRMWANMLGQAIYQIVVVLILFFDGYTSFGNPLRRMDETLFCPLHNYLWFICMEQLFNEINCCNLDGEFNVFIGILKNPLFCGILVSNAILQIIIVEFGSFEMSVSPPGRMTGKYWVGVGSVTYSANHQCNLSGVWEIKCFP